MTGLSGRSQVKVDSADAKRFVVATNLTSYMPTLALNLISYNVYSQYQIGEKEGIGLSVEYQHSLPKGSGGWFEINADQTYGFKTELIYKRKVKENLRWMDRFLWGKGENKAKEYLHKGYYLAPFVSYRRNEMKINDQYYEPEYVIKGRSYTTQYVSLGGYVGFEKTYKAGFYIDHALGLGVAYVQSPDEEPIQFYTNLLSQSVAEASKKYAFAPKLGYKIRLGWAF